MDPHEALVAALKREVHLLRAENAYFRSQVSPHPNSAYTWSIIHLPFAVIWHFAALPPQSTVYVEGPIQKLGGSFSVLQTEMERASIKSP